MENKDQNNSLSYGDQSAGQVPVSVGEIHMPPADADLSLEQDIPGPVSSQDQPKGQANLFLRLVRRADVLLLALLLAGGIGLFFVSQHHQQQSNSNTSAADSYGDVKIPLSDLTNGKQLTLTGSANVTINGPMQLNDALILAPSLQPTGAKPGQLYYDKTNNQLAYYNGSNFVFLTAQNPLTGVQSLGGATGQLGIGSGLTITNSQLNNSGVLTVQGRTGAVTLAAGPGLLLNGTTFSNTGILSIRAGNPNITVSNDGNGNVTLSVVGSGTGTVTSSGGTANSVPLFTGSQNIENSIISQSGLTVTISGDLSVVTGGLSLSNALTVSNGGTGQTSLAANGVLVGQGTGAVSSVTAGGSGLCLISTVGAPAWSACPSGGGVVSLNGLAGALTLSNASAAGSTITIDDASTTNKGIASFNGTNFTVTGGAVNTAQNINSTATPTFAGVNTNTITPSAALTMGVSAQTTLLQGSTTTIKSNGAGNDIVLDSANAIDLLENTFVSGSLTASGNLAANGGNITSTGALNVSAAGALTVGGASQTLTLQGGAATSFSATGTGNTTVVAFTNPVANTTLNFPALAAGTYTICTTSGNCAGAGVTLQSAYSNSSNPEITLDATRGALTIRDNSTPIVGNLLEVQNNSGSATYLAVTSSGIAVTGTATVSGTVNASTGTLQTNGTTRIDNSGNGVNLGSLTISGAISGGTSYTGSGNINSTAGGLQTNSTTRIDNGGNLINIAAVTAGGNATFQGGTTTIGTSSQAGHLALNDGAAHTGTLQVATLGQNTTYILPDPGQATATVCLTTGNCAGTGGGVTTGGGTTNKLAKFTGTQAIGDSSISDDGTNVTVAINVIVQGGDITLGTATQPASMILNAGNGQTTTLQAGASASNLNFILPTNAGTANQCLKQSGTGNQLVWQDCDGGAGGSSATLQTAYNNSTSPEIVLNSSVGALTIRDNSTPLGTNLFQIQNNLGSSTYLAVSVSGVNVTGTTTSSGNVNTTGGAVQTNSTTRIDNTGNLLNIGNITGTGPITVTSVGAGNDITVSSANNFVVQSAAVFNALSTFNANVDLKANNLVGTTGNISLTNFQVNGTNGNITAGTYNGQTISSSANFTGTVAVAGNTTLTGNLAVNGGNITSSGALNVTPGGVLTVGATGQQLILQGNGSTQLTSTASGFKTAVGFSGVPTAAVTYNFDTTAAAGTYTICTTVGNCTGSGTVTTSGGTIGTLPVFTGAQTLGNSLLSQSGSTVTVNGNLNVTTGNTFQVNGTQISSANLSNDANLAKLSASQTFTGNTVAFQNGANSTNALNIQNALGNRVLTVDTSNAQLVLGTASTLNGKLVFNNVSNANTVTIVPGTLTGNRTLTLPDASGVICTDSGNCAGAGSTLQTAYNFSVGGTTPKIKLNSTLLGVDIQDADTTIGANLFNVRASNSLGLGAAMFSVGNTGAITLQNASNSTSAFRLLTQGGTTVMTGDTVNGQVLLGQSGTLNGTLVFNNSTNTNQVILTTAAATGTQTVTLPDATGTICLSSGNCSGAGSSNTLQAAYDAGNTINTSSARNITFNLANSATPASFITNLQCAASCGTNGKFAIQSSGTNVFTVSPAGGAVMIQPTVDSTSAFNIRTSLGNNIFTVDSVNSRIGIGLGSGTLPTLASAGIDVKGALRLEGGASYADSYTTPNGSSISTMINIPNYDPGGFGQLLAMGLPSTANSTARAVSLFDARTTAHQPTLSVFNPAENSTVGFDWNGSNSDANVQTLDNSTGATSNILFRSGNISGGTGSSGTVYLESGSIAGGTGGFATGDVVLQSGVASGTTANSGSVKIDVGIATGTKGSIQIGQGNASTIGIGNANSATVLTLQGGTGTATGDVVMQAAAGGIINIGGNAVTNKVINLGSTGTTNAASTVNIASTNANQTQAVTIGNTGSANNVVLVQAGSSSTAIQLQAAAGGTISLANNAVAQTVNIGNGTGATAVNVTAGTAGITLQTGASSSGASGSITIDAGANVPTGTQVMNKTFETGTENMSPWFGVTSATSSTAQAHGGTHSLAIVENATSWGVQENYPGTLSVTPGHVYNFSAWVRGTAAETIHGYAAFVGSSAGNTEWKNVLDTTSGWTQFSGSLVAPAGSTTVYLSFVSSTGTGTATTYVDDVTVTDISSTNTPAINIGATNAQAITIGNASQTAATTLQGGAGGVNIATATGANVTISTTGAGNNYLKSGASTIVQSTTNNTTAFQIQGSSATLLDADTTNSRIGIGTTTPGAQLDVAGQAPTAVYGSAFASNNVYSVATQGKYAYTGNFSGLQIWDITRPSAPVSVGTGATTHIGISFIRVYGHYVIDTITSWDSIDIFDVSNPSAPTIVKNMQGTVTSINDIQVSGHYMYISTADTNNDLYVYDIINPASPVQVGVFSQTSYINSMAIQGRYMYASTSISNKLQVLDLNNPTSPVNVGSVAATATGKVVVNGRYAYIAGGTTLQAFNVANPASPASVGSFTLANNATDITLQGRDAYVSSDTGNAIYIIDVSNPASMASFGTISAGTVVRGIAIQGRYLYAGDYTNSKFLSYDIGGTYTQGLEAGSVSATNVDIAKSLTVGGQAIFNSGARVDGNVDMNGTLGVNGSALFQTSTNSTTGFQLQNQTGSSLLTGDTTNMAIDINGATSTNGVLNAVGGVTIQSLPAPSTLTITQAGTAGSTTYTYNVYACDDSGSPFGCSYPGPAITRTTTTGNATLSATNYNILTWSAVPGAKSYMVFMTAGPGVSSSNPQFLINTTSTTFNSTANTASYFPLPTAGSGSLVVAGNASVGNNLTVTQTTNTAYINVNGGGSNSLNGYLSINGSILQADDPSTIGMQGGIQISGLSTPSAPSVSVHGTTGSTSYTYYVAACSTYCGSYFGIWSGQTTPASTGTSVANGNATLSSTNYNAVSWSSVTGAVGYAIYRTSGATTSLVAIAGMGATSYNDTGSNVSTGVTLPTVDQTGNINAANGQFSNIDTASGAALNIGNYNATSIVLGKQSGTTNIATTINGTVNVRPNADSATAFQVQNAAANATAFSVDTIHGRAGVGTNAPGRTLDVAVTTTATNAPPFRIIQSGTGDSDVEFANSTSSFYMGMDASAGTLSIGSSSSAVTTTNSGQTATNNYDSGNNNMISSTQVVAGSTGSVSTISVLIGSVDATNKHMQVALYSNAGGTNALGTVLTSSATQTLTPNTWNTFSVPTTSVTSGTTYWLAFNVDGAGTQYGYANTGTSKWTNNTQTYGTWPNNPTIVQTQTTWSYDITMTIAPASVSDTFNNSIFSLSQSGAATFRPSVDSANAFRILNAASTPEFVVDTSAQKVYVGDPAGSNTTSLQVQGAATVNGLLTAGSFSGAGLTDCSGTNSKLLWTAATHMFSCGTDKPNVIVRKATAQTFTSTTLANDNDFTFSMGANETWAFQIETTAGTSANATGKVVMGISATTATTCRADDNDLYNVQNNAITSCTGNTGAIPATDNVNHEHLIWGTIVNGASAGTFNLQWAISAAGPTTTVGSGGYMVAYKLTGADLAEAYYTNDTTIGPGDLVQVDGSMPAGVKKTSAPYQSQAMGIVSTQPGQVLADTNMTTSAGHPVLLALNGRVPVKVSMENGPIHAGDYLTTSSTPGVAMRATHAGQMIGKAMEDWTGDSSTAEGVVMTFANLTYADPNSGTTGNTDLQGSTSVSDLNATDTITTNNLTVTGKADIANLHVGTMNVDNMNVTGGANIGGDINLQGEALSRNAIVKTFKASKQIAMGAVVIADPNNDGQVTTTTMAADTRVLGVALTSASAGQDVKVAIGGSVQVQSANNASINSGDLLVTSTQEGAVDKTVVPTVGSIVGKALSKPTDNQVWVLITLQ